MVALVKRTGRHPNDLAREAFGMMLEQYEAREFGSMVSRRAEQMQRPSDDPVVRHAYGLSVRTEAPLRGAQGAPWRTGPFRFDTLTCEACKNLVLGYKPQWRTGQRTTDAER